MTKFRFVTIEIQVVYEEGEEWGDQLPEGAVVKSVTVEYDMDAEDAQ